eukprot:2313472-Amphidinium_carterae.1
MDALPKPNPPQPPPKQPAVEPAQHDMELAMAIARARNASGAILSTEAPIDEEEERTEGPKPAMRHHLPHRQRKYLDLSLRNPGGVMMMNLLGQRLEYRDRRHLQIGKSKRQRLP